MMSLKIAVSYVLVLNSLYCMAFWSPSNIHHRWWSKNTVFAQRTIYRAVKDADALLEGVVLIDLLRSSSKRANAIEALINRDNAVTFDPGECKALLAACIETKSEELLKNLLQYFDTHGYLTSELLYAGIRMSNRKKAATLSYRMLLMIQGRPLTTDSETVETVIQALARSGKLAEAFDVLERAHNMDFGLEIECEVPCYNLVIGTAGRLQRLEIMMKALRMLETRARYGGKDIDSGLRNMDENIFLVALTSCSLTGKFTEAMEIFVLYEKLFGVVQTRAFSLLLMAYVISDTASQQKFNSMNSTTAFHDSTAAAGTVVPTSTAATSPASTSTSAMKTPKLDAIVTMIVRSNIDSVLTIANLILRFFCVRGDVYRAAIYLDRMRSMGHKPATTALVEYSELLCRLKDHERSVTLYAYLVTNAMIPSNELLNLCLDGISMKYNAYVKGKPVDTKLGAGKVASDSNGGRNSGSGNNRGITSNIDTASTVSSNRRETTASPNPPISSSSYSRSPGVATTATVNPPSLSSMFSIDVINDIFYDTLLRYDAIKLDWFLSVGSLLSESGREADFVKLAVLLLRAVKAGRVQLDCFAIVNVIELILRSISVEQFQTSFVDFDVSRQRQSVRSRAINDESGYGYSILEDRAVRGASGGDSGSSGATSRIDEESSAADDRTKRLEANHLIDDLLRLFTDITPLIFERINAASAAAAASASVLAASAPASSSTSVVSGADGVKSALAPAQTTNPATATVPLINAEATETVVATSNLTGVSGSGLVDGLVAEIDITTQDPITTTSIGETNALQSRLGNNDVPSLLIPNEITSTDQAMPSSALLVEKVHMIDTLDTTTTATNAANSADTGSDTDSKTVPPKDTTAPFLDPISPQQVVSATAVANPPSSASVSASSTTITATSSSSSTNTTAAATSTSVSATTAPGAVATMRWAAFRTGGYSRILDALLRLGGDEFISRRIESLFRRMLLEEKLSVHQSQLRSLMQTALVCDKGSQMLLERIKSGHVGTSASYPAVTATATKATSTSTKAAATATTTDSTQSSPVTSQSYATKVSIGGAAQSFTVDDTSLSNLKRPLVLPVDPCNAVRLLSIVYEAGGAGIDEPLCRTALRAISRRLRRAEMALVETGTMAYANSPRGGTVAANNKDMNTGASANTRAGASIDTVSAIPAMLSSPDNFIPTASALGSALKMPSVLRVATSDGESSSNLLGSTRNYKYGISRPAAMSSKSPEYQKSADMADVATNSARVATVASVDQATATGATKQLNKEPEKLTNKASRGDTSLRGLQRHKTEGEEREDEREEREKTMMMPDEGTQFVVDIMRQRGASIRFSSLTHKDVLLAFFHSGDLRRATEYFREIEKEADAKGQPVDQVVAEVYLSRMLQTEDPTEALSTLLRLEQRHSQLSSERSLQEGGQRMGRGGIRSNTSTSNSISTSIGASSATPTASNISDSSSSSAMSGGSAFTTPGSRFQVGALLYAKVMNVLLRYNRTDDVRALVPIIQAKNLTLETNQVHLFMTQEIRLNSPLGAIEAFNIFFPNIETECPDARAVSVLMSALRRINDPELCAEYARKLLPHINELGSLLRPSVYGLLARFARLGRDLDIAVAYLLKIPRDNRLHVPMCQMAKSCVDDQRPDLVLKLLEASPYPWSDLVAHAIAALSRGKLYVQALAYENLVTAEMGRTGKAIPWVFTFLLLSAAHRGYRDAARRIIATMTETWNIAPSELDYNLALMAHLRGALSRKYARSVRVGSSASASATDMDNTPPDDLNELFAMLYRMKNLGFGIHPLVSQIHVPTDLGSFGEVVGGLKLAMMALPVVHNPSAESRPFISATVGTTDSPLADRDGDDGDDIGDEDFHNDEVDRSAYLLFGEAPPSYPLNSKAAASAIIMKKDRSSTGKRFMHSGPSLVESTTTTISSTSTSTSMANRGGGIAPAANSLPQGGSSSSTGSPRGRNDQSTIRADVEISRNTMYTGRDGVDQRPLAAYYSAAGSTGRPFAGWSQPPTPSMQESTPAFAAPQSQITRNSRIAQGDTDAISSPGTNGNSRRRRSRIGGKQNPGSQDGRDFSDGSDNKGGVAEQKRENENSDDDRNSDRFPGGDSDRSDRSSTNSDNEYDSGNYDDDNEDGLTSKRSNQEAEGDFLADAGWLEKRKEHIHFSPLELEAMRLMETFSSSSSQPLSIASNMNLNNISNGDKIGDELLSASGRAAAEMMRNGKFQVGKGSGRDKQKGRTSTGASTRSDEMTNNAENGDQEKASSAAVRSFDQLPAALQAKLAVTTINTFATTTTTSAAGLEQPTTSILLAPAFQTYKSKEVLQEQLLLQQQQQQVQPAALRSQRSMRSNRAASKKQQNTARRQDRNSSKNSGSDTATILSPGNGQLRDNISNESSVGPVVVTSNIDSEVARTRTENAIENDLEGLTSTGEAKEKFLVEDSVVGDEASENGSRDDGESSIAISNKEDANEAAIELMNQMEAARRSNLMSNILRMERQGLLLNKRKSVIDGE